MSDDSEQREPEPERKETIEDLDVPPGTSPRRRKAPACRERAASSRGTLIG